MDLDFKQNIKHAKTLWNTLERLKVNFQTSWTILDVSPLNHFKSSIHTVKDIIDVLLYFLDKSEALATLDHFEGVTILPHLENIRPRMTLETF